MWWVRLGDETGVNLPTFVQLHQRFEGTGRRCSSYPCQWERRIALKAAGCNHSANLCQDLRVYFSSNAWICPVIAPEFNRFLPHTVTFTGLQADLLFSVDNKRWHVFANGKYFRKIGSLEAAIWSFFFVLSTLFYLWIQQKMQNS